jgi:hypothetical protein
MTTDHGVWRMTQAMLDATKAESYEQGVRYALNYVIKELGIDISDSDIAEEYLTDSKESN